MNYERVENNHILKPSGVSENPSDHLSSRSLPCSVPQCPNPAFNGLSQGKKNIYKLFCERHLKELS